MSECCFHVQIHNNYLWNISGGVAAATCFDLAVHANAAQGKSPRVESAGCVIKFVFLRVVMGSKGTAALLGLQDYLDLRGPLECLVASVLLDRCD